MQDVACGDRPTRGIDSQNNPENRIIGLGLFQGFLYFGNHGNALTEAPSGSTLFVRDDTRDIKEQNLLLPVTIHNLLTKWLGRGHQRHLHESAPAQKNGGHTG